MIDIYAAQLPTIPPLISSVSVSRTRLFNIFFSKNTGGTAAECKLAELVVTKKGETYVTIMSWLRARVSFALLRSALL